MKLIAGKHPSAESSYLRLKCPRETWPIYARQSTSYSSCQDNYPLSS